MSENTFKPIILETTNVYQELKNLSVKFGINIDLIDFNILSFVTRYKTEKDGEYVEVDQNNVEIFDNDEMFVNPEFSINQSFKVECFDKRTRPSTALPKVSLGINRNMTKVIATIKDDEEIKFSPNFQQELIDHIYKKLMKVGILIGIRNNRMMREISALTSAIRIKGSLDRQYNFIVTTGIEPIKQIDDELVYHYKEKLKNKDENDRVDYSQRGYLHGVVEGECVIEYIKPKEGTPGRSVKGDFLAVLPPRISNEITINHSDKIEKVDDEDSIKYIARKNGYVSDEGGSYDIKDVIDINEVSFKTTGSISTDLDSDVHINIRETDVLKDAVGSGMNIQTSHINVEGNIGKSATITANKAIIGGQTHAKSVIKAKVATIAVHRGLVEGEDIEINRLEGGVVRASVVKIGSVLGGEIIADEIYIEKLASNSSLIASKLIQITEVVGVNNKLLIDANRLNKDLVQAQDDKIKELRNQIKAMPRDIENKKNIIDANRASINLIKEKIKEFNDSKKPVPETFVRKLKEYQALVYEYNELLAQLNNKKQDLENKKNDLKEIQNQILEAKIVNKGRWRELNEIKFKLIEPDLELVYNTKDNELATKFMIKQFGDDQFEIKVFEEE